MTPLKKLQFLFFILLCIGCEKDNFEDIKIGKRVEYTISPNTHHATPLAYDRVRGVKTYRIRINFLKAYYEILDLNGNTSKDQGDWNKATGFSDCGYFDAYQGKGAMFVWRWDLEQKNIEVAAYVHNQADRSWKFKKFSNRLTPGKWYDLSISIADDANSYSYNLSNEIFQESILMNGEYGRTCSLSAISGRLITPYFGGNQKAPNEIRIGIEYL